MRKSVVDYISVPHELSEYHLTHQRASEFLKKLHVALTYVYMFGARLKRANIYVKLPMQVLPT